MAQTHLGAQKSHAKKLGITLDEYLVLVNQGLKFCTRCKLWQSIALFCKDKSRYDGIGSTCFDCRRVTEHKNMKGRLSPFKGKHHSEETKALFSEQRKGRVSKPYKSRKIKANCAICGKQIDVSPSDMKAGGFYCSKECGYKSLSLQKQGDKNLAWRGGCKLDRGRNWSSQRKLALKRDGDVCQYCGKINKSKRRFQVHHIKPYRTFNGDYIQANQLPNLIVLCGKCHGKAETGKIAIQPKLL